MKEVIQHIKRGGAAVIPTDTIYGIVASARTPKAVEKVYELKQRDENKPCIVLITDTEHLKEFDVTEEKIMQASNYWPGKVSVILPLNDANDNRTYLHRGTDSLAFRLPKKGVVKDILQATGPLVAPSANIQGQSPAHTIEEARGYFGDSVEYYDVGRREGSPSKLISLLQKKPQRLR